MGTGGARLCKNKARERESRSGMSIAGQGGSMKKRILTGALALALVLSAQADGDRLAGSWKSNKEATLDYLKAHTALSSEQLKRVGAILGKQILTFDGHSLKAQS